MLRTIIDQTAADHNSGSHTARPFAPASKPPPGQENPGSQSARGQSVAAKPSARRTSDGAGTIKLGALSQRTRVTRSEGCSYGSGDRNGGDGNGSGSSSGGGGGGGGGGSGDGRKIRASRSVDSTLNKPTDTSTSPVNAISIVAAAPQQTKVGTELHGPSSKRRADRGVSTADIWNQTGKSAVKLRSEELGTVKAGGGPLSRIAAKDSAEQRVESSVRLTDKLAVYEESKRQLDEAVAAGEVAVAGSARLPFCCTPPLPLAGVSIAMERERQQNDRTLANGYRWRPALRSGSARKYRYSPGRPEGGSRGR